MTDLLLLAFALLCVVVGLSAAQRNQERPEPDPKKSDWEEEQNDALLRHLYETNANLKRQLETQPISKTLTITSDPGLEAAKEAYRIQREQMDADERQWKASLPDRLKAIHANENPSR